MNKTLYFAVFLTVTAALVTAIAYLGYELTAPKIAENRDIKITNSIALLYSPDDGYTKNDDQPINFYQELDRKYSSVITGVYEVLDSDLEVHAIIYNVKAQGRNGLVNALIAIDPFNDTVVAVTYYEHGETPNIGEKYTREDEIDKLLGQTIPGVTVDVIAGASTTWIAIDEMFRMISTHYVDEEVHIDG